MPARLEDLQRRAIRLEWISIAYLLSAIVAIYFTLGSSQAMKGAWLEDMLSLAPPIAFLISSRVRYRAPDARHPYGYHRAVEVAFLAAALALLLMGIYLILDSALDLLKGDHPPIGMVELFDWQVWLGWLMLAALVWSAVPAVVLGQMKKRIAAELHDKVLYADAQMNKADWMTASAAMAGVIGIGFGLWWADAVAAIVIGLDIAHDGVKYSRGAVADIIDGQPRRHDEEGTHPLVAEVRRTVAGMDWVHEAAVRMRELGHIFSVEVLVIPVDQDDLVDRIEDGVAQIRDLDWKLQDVVISPVRELEGAPHEVLVQRRSVAAGA
jgi:divalent metal cation (Fe/Co/Zn/Cd) transporter